MENEEVALKQERADMLFVHREVRPKASAPDWSNTHVASRCPPTSTQGEESSCRTDAAPTAFETAAHASITDGTHVHARDATLVHCAVNNDRMNEFQWLRVCAVVVL